MERTIANKIFFGGKIITVDEANSSPEAVAVKDGRIMDVGTYDQMLVHKGQDTEMIDLQGNTLMPGFVDPHCHFEVAAFVNSLEQINCRVCKSSSEVMEKIHSCVENTEPGKWVALVGYDQLTFPDLPNLDRKVLDGITSDHPLLIMTFTFHVGYVNSKAFEALGITNKSQPPAGGVWALDENGELSGILRESPAIAPFIFAYLNEKQFDLKKAVVNQANEYRSYGVTTSMGPGIFEMFPAVSTYDVIKDVVTNDACPVRHGYTVLYERIDNGKTTWEEQPKVNDNDKFFCTGVKMFYDGAPYGATALMKKPYLNSEQTRKLNLPEGHLGHRMHPDMETFKESVLKYHAKGCQIQVHCQGDLAIKEMLDLFEYAMEKCPRYGLRHRLEHCMVMDKADIARAKKLGVCMSYHVNHIRFYGENMRDQFLGKERAENSFAMRTALRMGHRISLHADSPMLPGDILSLISTAVTRKTIRGEVIGADEGITLDQAIRAATIDSAYQCFMEEKVGSIEVGKFADFVVLADDPYQVAPEQIANIKILDTYLAGEKTKPMKA